MSKSKQQNNPQFEQMADESMVRCLDAQAQIIWPLESPLLDRYQLKNKAKILDLGCGTCEITSRLINQFPSSHVTAVDLIEEHLNYAKQKYTDITDQITFQVGDAMNLDLDSNQFDLSVSRHLLQAVPDAKQVINELVRVTKPSGTIHILAEDYGMMHFSTEKMDIDHFWREGPWKFAQATGTDLRSGRKIISYLKQLNLKNIQVDYLPVDTVNCDSQILANVFQAWKDGYAPAIAEHTEINEQQANAYFDAMIECILDPQGYALWQVPIFSAKK